MKNVVILENIRSAYNVGNVIRTADALGRDVWLVGYTPSSQDTPKVSKTSLGAEEHVGLKRFDISSDVIAYAKASGYCIVAAEITQDSIPLDNVSTLIDRPIAVIFGNEVDGVLPDTLAAVEKVIHIPMNGIKESLNIGQSAAIFMRELRQK